MNPSAKSLLRRYLRWRVGKKEGEEKEDETADLTVREYTPSPSRANVPK